MQFRTFVTGLCLIAFAGASTAQQKTLSLPDALKNAEQHYPSLQQKPLLEAREAENMKMLHNALLPRVNVTGQATYQSEITSLELPGFPSDFGLKKDNYDIGLDVRLPLTQLGTVQSRKQLEQAQLNLDVSQIDLDLQRVRETVTTIFGNILLQKENAKILTLRLGDLDTQEKKVAIGVNNGAVLRSNQLVLESEILSTQQRMDDISATVQGLVKQLALYTNLPVDTSTQLVMPDILTASQPINRPELKVFQAQRHILDIKSDLSKKETRPNLYVFTQGFFGRPGYNFLNTNFRLYGIGGIGLEWNLNNLLNQRSQQAVIGINRNMVTSQEETFSLNLQAALIKQQAEIDKYQSIITKDDQIVKNRQEIARAASSQLDNGAITSTEYLTELNALNTAQSNLLLHKVQLSIAKTQYQVLTGY